MEIIIAWAMVHVLDGSSEIGADVGAHLCYLIFTKHLIRSRAVRKLNFHPERPFLLHLCATCPDISTMVEIERKEAERERKREAERETNSAIINTT